MSHVRKPTLGFFVAIAIVVGLLVPALYVLSAGPALFLVITGVIGEDVFDLAYTPLDFVSDYVPEWFDDRFGEYLGWWGELGVSTET